MDSRVIVRFGRVVAEFIQTGGNDDTVIKFNFRFGFESVQSDQRQVPSVLNGPEVVAHFPSVTLSLFPSVRIRDDFIVREFHNFMGGDEEKFVA